VCRGLPFLLALLAAGCAGSTSGGTDKPRFDSHRAFNTLKAEVAIGPRPAGSPADRRDARFIAARLRSAGVREVRIQRPYLNVVGRIPGAAPGAVVLGAHHDTKEIPEFVGANDGASGVATLLEVARDLRRPLAGPSIDLAFFDAEESPGRADTVRAFERGGDRGSRQYLRYAAAGGRQGSPPLRSIRAMILFDMVGDCDLRIPREASSDRGLYRLFANGSGRRSPFGGTSGAILDDQSPFERAGIPALDLIDLDYGPGPPPGAWWHTTEDDLAHVCPSSLRAVGAPALAAIPRIR